MSLKTALIRNIGASSISKLVSVAYLFISVYILIINLGVKKYGIWLVISAIPSWLSMSDMGFGSVAANEMSIRASKNNWYGANQVFQSALMAIIGLSLLMFIAIFFLAFYGNWTVWLNITFISQRELTISLLFLGLASILSLQGSLAGGLFRAAGRSDISIILNGISPVIDLVGILISTLFFNSISALSITLFVTKSIYIIGSLTCGLRFCNRIKINVSFFSKNDFIYCLKKGLAFCIFPLGNAIILQGSTLIVNNILGSTAVVIFNTCRQLTRSAQQIMNLVGQSVAPEFSQLIGKNDLLKARKLHYFTLILNLFLACGMILILLVIGPEFYKFWVKGKIAIDRILILCFCIGVIGNALWFSGSTIIGASNRHERLSIYYLIAALISLLFCFYGVKYFGINGGAFASIFADIVLVPIVFLEALKITKESNTEFFNGLYSTFIGFLNSLMHTKAKYFKNSSKIF